MNKENITNKEKPEIKIVKISAQDIITDSTGGDDSCLVKGTKITMPDGSLKNIEELKVGDKVLTFNHETGVYEPNEIYYIFVSDYTVVPSILHFENGVELGINMHYLFEQESNEYVLLTHDNAKDFIGKHFYSCDDKKFVELKNITYGEETIVYTIYTKYVFTSIANGMLNVPDDNGNAINIYKFDENLVADPEELKADIEKYGLHEYDENSCLTRQQFDEFLAKYLNILYGKNKLSKEYVDKLYEEFFKK